MEAKNGAQNFFDPTYEADAPKFFDFQKFLDGNFEEDENGDDWFLKNEVMLLERSLDFVDQVSLQFKNELSIDECKTENNRPVLCELQIPQPCNTGNFRRPEEKIAQKSKVRRSSSLHSKFKLTCPKSPNLRSTSRAAAKKKEAENALVVKLSNDALHQRISAKSSTETLNSASESTRISRASTPKIIQNRVKRVTTPKPFSFENRDLAWLENRKKLMEQCENENLIDQQLKARRPPESSKNRPTPTKIQPFKFRTDEIHATHERKLKAKQVMEEEIRIKAQLFHAQPADVLKKQPFKPRTLHHEKIVPKILNLNTEKRAENRQKFDELLKEKEQEKEETLKKQNLEKQQEEERLIKEMRRLAVHKAQPVRHYSNVPPRPQAAFTMPESPKFLLEQRLENRKQRKKIDFL